MRPLGILGGGQLARMLALRASALGIPVAILSESKTDPAAQVSSLWRKGSLKSQKDLLEFLRACSVVTFESEFLDANLLAVLSQRTQTPIYPHPHHMALLQDRWTQKNLLNEMGLLTSPFIRVDNVEDAQDAYLEFDGQLVFKKRRFGYDGNGTFVVKSVKTFEQLISAFEKASGDAGLIAERFVPFEREIAIMIGRSVNGQTVSLPFVESFQENSRCLWVNGPLEFNARSKKLESRLINFLKQIGYVGMMGVELFETKSGELIVNELAPRVHNSGHYSMDALNEDQFGLHLKSVLGMAIEKPRLLAPGFAMYNLLGQTERTPQWKLPADVKLHWYGKSENRLSRKMGHFNVLAEARKKNVPARADALARAKTARADFKL